MVQGMYCHRCGTPNSEQATTCTNCGTVLVGDTQPGEQPSQPAGPEAVRWPAPQISQPGPVQQGAQPWGSPPQVPNIPNYLIQSILVTLFCCIPLGIVAIVFAAQVNTKIAQGDIPGALEASSRAKLFCWISFGIGLVAIVLWSAFFAAAVVGGDF